MLTQKHYKIGRLYFRHIRKTPLEKDGWSAKTLAEKLEANGLIKVLHIQGFDKLGRWTEKVERYVELRPITYADILKALK